MHECVTIRTQNEAIGAATASGMTTKQLEPLIQHGLNLRAESAGQIFVIIAKNEEHRQTNINIIFAFFFQNIRSSFDGEFILS